MKLNKTETLLVERAKEFQGLACVETGYDLTSTYRTRSYGTREYNALRSLERKGVIRVLGHEATRGCLTLRGSHTIFRYELVAL